MTKDVLIYLFIDLLIYRPSKGSRTFYASQLVGSKAEAQRSTLTFPEKRHVTSDRHGYEKQKKYALHSAPAVL